MSESFPNVEVSIFSSLLTPSLPQPRTAAPEPMHDYWSLALEYNTLPWRRVCNRPEHCVSQLHVFMRKGVCVVFCKQKPCLFVCGSNGWWSRPPMLWRKATGWCQGTRKVLPILWVYLGWDLSANKILHLARYTEGVDCVGKWTHLVWGLGTDFGVYILPKTCSTFTWLAGTLDVGFPLNIVDYRSGKYIAFVPDWNIKNLFFIIYCLKLGEENASRTASP